MTWFAQAEGQPATIHDTEEAAVDWADSRTSAHVVVWEEPDGGDGS